MGADISAFGNIGRILRDLGNAEKTREVSATSLNWLFISRWTCLSIVVIRKLLDSPRLRENASGAILTLGTIHEADNFNPAESALKNARRMDKRFMAAWGCVERPRGEFKGSSVSDRRGGKVEETLLRYKPQLDDVKAEADRMKVVDECISRFQNQIDQVSHNLTRGLPGVDFDELTGAMPIGQVFDFPVNPVRPQNSCTFHRDSLGCPPLARSGAVWDTLTTALFALPLNFIFFHSDESYRPLPASLGRFFLLFTSVR